MATIFGSQPILASLPLTTTRSISSSSSSHQQQHMIASSSQTPTPPPPQKPPIKPLPSNSNSSTKVDSTDWIATSLTRRFGLGAGLAWVGFLAFGVISEQIKTRLEVSQQQANTRNVEKEEEVTLPNGIRYYDLKVGGGASPRPGDLVVIDIMGKIESSGEVFVNTFDDDDDDDDEGDKKKKKALALVMGSRPYSKGVCEGIEYVLKSMKSGGKRKVIVPPQLGFRENGGDLGSGVLIPPNATLEYIVQVGYQFLFFVVTALLKFDKVTDFAGSTNFVILAVLTLLLKASWHFRQIILTLFVVLWGLRLGVFLLLRILQWGEDRRFDEMRNNLGQLAIFWIFQAVWVWTVSLPVTLVNASDRNPFLHVVDIIGWIMWSVGFIVEGAADQQKLRFKQSSESRGRWCNVGLWKYSRHPNYFGEILLWWGVFLASTPVLKGAEWLVIIGPIFLTLLLLFISGIPMLEDSADKKFGNVEGYMAYKQRTSPLIPLPPPVYGNLPAWFKTTFLFEFPLYSRNLPQEELNW